MIRRRNDWEAWWSGLDREDRRSVRAWLTRNPPPTRWLEGTIAYAFTEMPFAPRGEREVAPVPAGLVYSTATTGEHRRAVAQMPFPPKSISRR